jgi:thermolabile hemolysin
VRKDEAPDPRREQALRCLNPTTGDPIMKKSACRVTFAIVFALFCITSGYAEPFDQVVIFGDSLSDNGNLVLIDDQPEPDPSIYYMGRFSNGPVWVEYLVEPGRLNAPLVNRALGGAQSEGLTPPGLIEQVIGHISLVSTPLSPDTLFIIWIGGNDHLYGDRDFQSTVDNINEAMEHLVNFGGMHLLVLNLPDLGATPSLIGSPESGQATQFTINFNTALGESIEAFRAGNPGIGVYTFDVNAFFAAIRNDPQAYGFIDVNQPSPNFDIPDNFDGAGHLFWDDLHPTTQTHVLLADHVLVSLDEQVGSAPEGGAAEASTSSSSCFIGALGMGR